MPSAVLTRHKSRHHMAIASPTLRLAYGSQGRNLEKVSTCVMFSRFVSTSPPRGMNEAEDSVLCSGVAKVARMAAAAFPAAQVRVVRSANTAAMSGEVLKADRDFTKEVDSLIPEAESLAAQGQTQNAIDKLLGLEKQTRQASDLPSTSRVIIKIVTICKESGDWSLLNEQVLVLSKKHSQLKQAITKMVQVVMGFLDDVPDMERKLSVIETLRTVTEGKSSGHG
ncbi:hypothetical protein KC364_g62 [Hortaea werneckii]|nr:hypothetical protein KC364_g62 [Hortaea werneckii]